MIKRKNHIWKKLKGINGSYQCARCLMYKHRSTDGNGFYYVRNNRIDKSETRDNCFILSKY